MGYGMGVGGGVKNLMTPSPAPLMSGGAGGNYHPYGRMQSPMSVGGGGAPPAGGRGFGAGSSGGYAGGPGDNMYGADGGAFSDG